MPKPLLNTSQKQDREQRVTLNSIISVSTKVDPVLLERRLRQKRSTSYIQAVKQLDIGGHTMNRQAFDSFVDAIRNEFPEIPFENHPVGIVAKCYLGAPYEVHTLDITGSIIMHYKMSESLPPLMERARSIAMHGGYEFIEVYVDSLRAVKVDGSVSVVR